MDPTKPVAKGEAPVGARPDAPDRLLATAVASDDWTPVWKAVERLIPETVTSSRRLTALYELLQGWKREDQG